MINKEILQHNFSIKADNYETKAILQKNCAKKLCDLALPFIDNKSTILDLGSGTSAIAKNLITQKKSLEIFEVDFAHNMLNHWRERPSNVFPICADIENLPFENPEIFDAIFSSFSLQWLENYDEIFTKLHFLLKKNGILAICLPIKNSLAEIIEASEKSQCNFFMKELPSLNFLAQIISQNNFENKFTQTEIITKKYQNALDPLREIKEIGANYSKKSIKNFISKKNLQKFNDFFAQKNNMVSWHINYLIFTKNV